MSLHGTLETFPLPDVLALLAATKKNGELRVVGGRVDGRVWFDAGQVVGQDVAAAPVLVDAFFELLRLKTGKFSFDADRAAPSPSEPVAVDSVLEEAQARLAEWEGIEAVVPSLFHGVRLVPEVRDPHVMVSGPQWRALVAVAGHPTVQGVVDALGAGEFAGCKVLKELVEGGLVAVEVSAAPAPAPTPVAAPAPEPERQLAPEPEPQAPAPKIAAAKPDTPGAQIDALTSTAGSAAAVALKDEPRPQAKPRKPKAAEATETDQLVEQVANLAKVAGVEAEAPKAEAEAEAETASSSDDEQKPEAGAGEGDEPINRGLLLKFLSSVRT